MPKFRWKTNATADVPDLRDWFYKPTLRQLSRTVAPPRDQKILNQHSEGACTGFALAAAINYQYQLEGEPIRVSPRMLYEMARRFDEWPGEEYDGSSLRGAIKGWANMGVCEESFWPYRVTRKGDLTVRRAKNARSHTLGAYYRIEPDIVHYHAALNETGVIVVSAQVHSGWNEPEDGVIVHEREVIGGHSFAVTGYDERGFWVQNSWGSGWGDEGLALWTYEDWIENVWDAWVFRLALPTPQIFGLRPQNATRPEEETEYVRKVPRSAIAGHFVHVDDGHYKRSGRYWSTPFDVEETARLVAASEKYDHLLIYVHGGLNTPEDSAVRIDHMRDVFKANRIYPFHVMYDTGLVEELLDVIRRKEAAASGRVGAVSDWIDRFIEGLLRDPGTLLWEEMKRDACQAFAREGAATDALDRFLANLKKKDKKMGLHLVGHSTGGVALGALLDTLRRRRIRIDSCSLMAPACTVEWYAENYLPVLAGETRLRLEEMTIYNLINELERDDNVAQIYRKSLLYLVSNAFEGEIGRPLLGMEKFSRGIEHVGELPFIHYSNGISGARTRSTSHGGFDNDTYTMNHILQRVLGHKPERPFTEEDLDY